MNDVIAIQYQTLFDICLQTTGDISKVFEMALENEISVTDQLVIGQSYNSVDISDKPVHDYYVKHNIIPVCGESINDNNGGIGWMGIEFDFIIN